ncbi:histidine--tRNA ligase [Clostridiaceae bacterium HSG29]|nr:histidine--tRNA ligase [Clostridiaceae bacterium HSG29]
MKFRRQPAKGTQDVLPKDMALRNYILDIIKKTYAEKGFTQIQTPSVEDINLLTNSDGGENLRMLFKILKRGDKLNLENASENDITDLGLRFDLTLPLSRFYANNRNELSMPFKAVQIGDVWRAERPQKGRYRQFMQCDVDIIGEKSIIAEIELLMTVPEVIHRLGFKNFVLKINDRRLLKDMVTSSDISEDIFSSICISLDKADKIGIEGVKKELSAKELTDTQIESLIKRMDTKLEDLDSEAAKEINEIIKVVSKYYPIEFDPTLVRGMGYYTGSIFEVQSNEFKGSLGGGGRYDNLLNKFQNDTIPAVGFSIGFERIVDLLKTKNIEIDTKEKVALVYINDEYLEKTVELSKEMSDDNKIVSMFKVNKNKVGKKIKKMEEEGFTNIIVVDKM